MLGNMGFGMIDISDWPEDCEYQPLLFSDDWAQAVHIQGGSMWLVATSEAGWWLYPVQKCINDKWCSVLVDMAAVFVARQAGRK